MPPSATGAESAPVWFLRWAITIGLAVGLSLLFKIFLFQAFSVPSESMVPELEVGDRFVAEKVTYRFQDIGRGDVVVFTPPASANAPAGVAFYVKRVVGLPGETIQSIDGQVIVDGTYLEESYLPSGTITSDFAPVTLQPGEIFVMGDNRPASGDSRVFGPLDVELIVGRGVFLFWPHQRPFH